MTERVVLAYSGGLDTSVAIGWIAEETGAEVIAVAGDVGQGGEDMDVIRQRALDCGAVESIVADMRDEFADEFCLPALQANALYMDRYPLVSALSRPLIVKHLVAAAKYHGASMVAHGCTGKGNDQVRFEVGIGALGPGPQVLAPVRDSGMTRDKAIAFAEEKGLPIDDDQEVAVLDRPERLGPRGRDRLPRGHLERPDRGRLRVHPGPGRRPRRRRGRHQLHRRRPDVDRRPAGDHAAGDRASSTRRAGAQGVGRLDMVEDRLVGIKSREVYEAPGAIALITAHQELENVTVERDLARFKRTVEQRWAELVYDGLWFSPLKRALDAFVAESQRARHRRDPDDAARRPGRRHRPAQRGLALRLQPGHLRHRRHLRPGAWPRASSSCGACRRRSPRRGTSGSAAPRELRDATPRRPGCGAAASAAARRRRWPRCRSRRDFDWRLAPYDLAGVPGARPGAAPAPGCSPTTSSAAMLGALDELSAEVAAGTFAPDRGRRGRAHGARARAARAARRARRQAARRPQPQRPGRHRPAAVPAATTSGRSWPSCRRAGVRAARPGRAAPSTSRRPA